MRSLNLAVWLLLLSSVVAYAGEGRGDANGAWHIFRQAVINGDSDQAATMTKFPLEVRGEDDSDPVRYYDRKNFSVVFLKLISQQKVLLKGNGLVRRPVVELVKEKLDLVEKDFQSSNQFRVYDFVFTRTKGRWSFVVGYLAD
jgi:hypothetical protein